MVIFSEKFLSQNPRKMVASHSKGSQKSMKIVLGVLFLIALPWWTFAGVEASTSLQNTVNRHSHHSEIPAHRKSHHIPYFPTAAGHLVRDGAIPSFSSSPPHRYATPPTKIFYKSASIHIRSNGSISDASIIKKMPPPNVNPWYTLYRPSVSPQYPLRTKKPIEPSWKPAQMVLDEVPRIAPTRPQESKAKQQQQQPPKDYYKHLYGTQEGVKHLKGHYGPSNLSEAKNKIGISQDLEDVRLANEHFLRMRSNGRCRVPVAEVVCVKDLYPNPTKEYLPRCTLLHRCGDRSGCCDSEELSCVARAVQEVALNFYFYGSKTTVVMLRRELQFSEESEPLKAWGTKPRTTIVHVDLPASHVGLENSVEKLFFTNHTECECIPNPSSPTPASSSPTPEYEADVLVKDDPPLQDNDNEKELRLNEIGDEEEEEESEEIRKTSKCRDCPKPYFQRQYPDGRCGCDCFDRQKPCLRVKRGREALLDHEKRCVESNHCDIPECEYGTFITSIGRCPKKPEDFQKPGKIHGPRSLHNPNHRWTYFERD